MSVSQDYNSESPEAVETFRNVDDDEFSDGDIEGCLKSAYSFGDMMEELARDGSTINRRIPPSNGGGEPIYENLSFPADDNDDYGWSSSEFEDDDDAEEADASNREPASLDTFFQNKEIVKDDRPEEEAGKSQMSRGRAFLDGLKRYKNVRQSRMLDKLAQVRLAKFGQRKSRAEDPDQVEADLEPLNFDTSHRVFKPACLPILLPEDLTSAQMKRRQIMNAIVESEKSYLLSLRRLIEEYQVPLLQAQPPIINHKYVKVIFYKVRDIMECHLLFHGELYNVADKWDEEEKIGDVFVASFSKSTVFEAYSSFVNNFSTAMEQAKKQARIKSAFNSFLKNKLETSSDKLSLFGLMVKPVQRFPQFILLIQDLLKNSPKDHPDRLSLQSALTELEMLTDRLNETKRECESRMEAVRLSQLLHLSINSNKQQPSLFIRLDDVVQHKIKDGETESKLKRLFMLSDQLVCASVTKQRETADQGESLVPSCEKVDMTWSAPIKEVEVVDPKLPTFRAHPLSRQSSGSGTSGRKSQERQGKMSPGSMVPKMNPYWKDLDSMLHDLKIFEQMMALHSQLKLKYDALPLESLKVPVASLEILIRQKLDVDKNTVAISIPTRSFYLVDGMSNIVSGMPASITELAGRSRKSFTLEFPSLTVKHDWLIELQSAKLATDPDNSPAWYLSENDPLSSRNPRFMTALKMDAITKEEKRTTLLPKKKVKDELNCCTYVTLPCHNKPGSGMRHLWACVGGRAVVVSLHTNQPFVVECVNVADGNVVAAECVWEPQPTPENGVGGQGKKRDPGVRFGPEGREIVWMVTDDNKICMVPAIQSKRQAGVKSIKVDGARVRCMKHLNNKVYLGTWSGLLIIYSRNDKGEWNFNVPQKMVLGEDAVSCLMVADDNTLWAACSSVVHIVEVQPHLNDPHLSAAQLKASHNLLPDGPSTAIECLVKAGVGLLVSFAGQSTVKLFHAETFQHLQDISISSAVSQLLEEKGTNLKPEQLASNLSITCMLPNKGVLYVGTSQGFVLTLPLPRLNGMPQFRQRPAISFQSHVGPVRFLASINCSLVESSAQKEEHPRRTNAGLRPVAVESDGVGGGTALVENQMAAPTHGGGQPIASDQDVNGHTFAPPIFTPNLSTSSPNLTEHVGLYDMKCQQMNSLYESLLKDVQENSDDAVVLERIASTPLPYRRHRIQHFIKSSLASGKDVSCAEVPPANQETGNCQVRGSQSNRRDHNLRHSSAELLRHTCAGVNENSLLSVVSESCEEAKKEGPSSIAHGAEAEVEVSGQEVTFGVEGDNSEKLAKSNEPEVAVEGRNGEGICCGDREISDEIYNITSHLNKSVSFVGDTPPQKSSSTSTAGQTPDSSVPMFTVPSNTAMISSNLTTTPKSRAIVFVSAGQGHISWNSHHKTDRSPDKPFLLLWMR